MAATTAGTLPVAKPADEPIDKRKLIAFLGMVFGMFMAILDIQIVSASLSQIQAGLAAAPGVDSALAVQALRLAARFRVG